MSSYTRRAMLATWSLTGLSASMTGLSALTLPHALLASPQPPLALTAESRALLAYFTQVAPKLLRPAEGILAHPSVSPSLPGKEYSTSLWDWDTYWTSRGLFQLARTNRDQTLHQQVVEHARGSLMNFLDHQSPEGRLPILLDIKDPDPFGSLKKAAPNSKNQAKPVMAQLALLVADESNAIAWLEPVFDRLLRFCQSWILGNQTASGLFVWGDDVAIGNDNDPTTFGRPNFSSANLLLNCLFYQEYLSAAELARRLQRPADADLLATRARQLGEAINRLCWDPRDSFYYTVDVQSTDRRAELIPNVPPGMPMTWSTLPLRIQTFTGFLPLWCGVASPQQAASLVATNYTATSGLRAPAGVRSLSNRESMYSLAKSSNPSNWLGPIWIIVNYFAWKALLRYGFHAEATELAAKTIRILSADLATNGSLNEYYDPETGKALSHPGFLDWNMLVLEMMAA
jgi:putative isomerase